MKKKIVKIDGSQVSAATIISAFGHTAEELKNLAGLKMKPGFRIDDILDAAKTAELEIENLTNEDGQIVIKINTPGGDIGDGKQPL